MPQRIIHPWRKSYTTNQQAIWEHDPEYCQRVMLIHLCLKFFFLSIKKLINDSKCDRFEARHRMTKAVEFWIWWIWLCLIFLPVTWTAITTKSSSAYLSFNYFGDGQMHEYEISLTLKLTICSLFGENTFTIHYDNGERFKIGFI